MGQAAAFTDNFGLDLLPSPFGGGGDGGGSSSGTADERQSARRRIAALEQEVARLRRELDLPEPEPEPLPEPPRPRERTPRGLDVRPGPSLYERLGGEVVITVIVDDFVARAAGDPRVNFTRKGHPNEWDPTPAAVTQLKRRLVEFLGMATGGPQKYVGRDMVSSHTGMNITAAEFTALAQDLKATLDKYKIPRRDQDELLAIVATTKDQIVGK